MTLTTSLRNVGVGLVIATGELRRHAGRDRRAGLRDRGDPGVSLVALWWSRREATSVLVEGGVVTSVPAGSSVAAKLDS